MQKLDNMYNAIGTMSGTSCDGVDVCLIETDGMEIVKSCYGKVYEYSSTLQKRIKFLMEQYSRISSVDYQNGLNAFEENRERLILERDLTIEHARAISDFLRSNGIDNEKIDVIGLHGQTLYHNPQEKIINQIGDPQLLSTLIKTNVISDFRRRDIANGGQGAPLVPIFHKFLAKYIEKNIHQNSPIVFLNIGGVSNITYIDGEDIIASDVGFGNAMIDDIAARTFGVRYDDRGAISAKGSVIYTTAMTIIDDPFFSKPPPKSMDRNHLQNSIGNILKEMSAVDAMATLSECIVIGIKKSILSLPKIPKQIIVYGGGRRNEHIMRKLRASLNCKTQEKISRKAPVEEANTKNDLPNIDHKEELTFNTKSNNIQIDVTLIDEIQPSNNQSTNFDLFNGDIIEAYAFGYLSVRSLLNLPITFPSTTGTKTPVSGGTICFY